MISAARRRGAADRLPGRSHGNPRRARAQTAGNGDRSGLPALRWPLDAGRGKAAATASAGGHDQAGAMVTRAQVSVLRTTISCMTHARRRPGRLDARCDGRDLPAWAVRPAWAPHTWDSGTALPPARCDGAAQIESVFRWAAFDRRGPRAQSSTLTPSGRQRVHYRGQVRPTMSPFSSMSMCSAAGWALSPGIVRMPPLIR